MLRAFSRLLQSKPKIEIFVRHCHFSSVSQHKKRLRGFSKQHCHENLMRTKKDLPVTFILDSHHPASAVHFVRKQTTHPVIEIKEGTEAGSFLKMLDYVCSLKLDPETIIYFLEDDYLHREGWPEVLLEGFSIPGVSYVTLYDHKDKYFSPSYADLHSKLYHTKSCHWRTTPSTTNTYAMRFKTLLKDLEIHREYSLGQTVSLDHKKFCALQEKGAVLISSVPGWSTHGEPAFASPCIDWEKV